MYVRMKSRQGTANIFNVLILYKENLFVDYIHLHGHRLMLAAVGVGSLTVYLNLCVYFYSVTS
jgi:hypothetical protein